MMLSREGEGPGTEHSGLPAAGGLPRSEAGEALACRRLWCAVLEEQADLIIGRTYKEHGLDTYRARLWFRSRDFRIVCALCGLDPDYIRRGVSEASQRLGRGAV